MRKAAPFWLTILVAAVALAASGLLYVDYVRPLPVFCAADGGCGAVKKTIFAYPLGVSWLPMPVFGIGGFLAIALASLVPGRRARLAQAALAGGAALVATGLLVVQAAMHTICPYCAATDLSALVVAALSVHRLRRGWDPPEHKLHVGVAAAGTLVAIAAPIGVGFAKKPLPSAVPDAIAAEIQRTPRGKVTIVDFVDYECPFCRMTHAELAPLLVAYRDQLRLVRKNVPLRMHPHAMDAARTAVCGEAQGKGDEVAEALMRAEDLTAEGGEAIARERGLDLDRFRACTKDPATDASIKADQDTFKASKGHGLPTIFVGTIKLEGAQQRDEIEAAIKASLGGH
jgi:protein-disulfide isomerase